MLRFVQVYFLPASYSKTIIRLTDLITTWADVSIVCSVDPQGLLASLLTCVVPEVYDEGKAPGIT